MAERDFTLGDGTKAQGGSTLVEWGRWEVAFDLPGNDADAAKKEALRRWNVAGCPPVGPAMPADGLIVTAIVYRTLRFRGFVAIHQHSPGGPVQVAASREYLLDVPQQTDDGHATRTDRARADLMKAWEADGRRVTKQVPFDDDAPGLTHLPIVDLALPAEA